MLKVENVSKFLAGTKILNKINFTISRDEVVGLVGKNGAGKTTLFKLILNELQPDKGSINIQNEVIAYLKQKPEFSEETTVDKFFKHKLKNKHEAYKIDRALSLIGLEDLERQIPAENLSAGQKTRVFLASLLISEPDPTFLLLDEPTNHLDINGLEWLEKYIFSFRGSVLLTSHDRALLDSVADKILELEDGKISAYGGNYSFYRQQKQIQKQAYERKYKSQQKRISKLQESIKNAKNKTKSGEQKFSSRQPYQRRKIRKVAQAIVARQKRLEKFLESEEKLEKPEQSKSYRVGFSGKTYSGKTILDIKHLAKAFSGNQVLLNVSFSVFGDERVWLYGLNGSGKTTILKIIHGDIDADEGKVELGYNINVGYYSQEGRELNKNNTVLKELSTVGFNRTEAYKEGIKFGLEEIDLSKKIKQLSLGQKAKVAFAKLVCGNYQLLLLDEPTNHLDVETREIIEDALSRYKGAILVVSHDRYFLNSIDVDRKLLLKDGAIHKYR